MNRYGYIYMHQNLANDRIYIGQSTQSEKRRFRKNEKSYNSYANCTAFHRALVKYGWKGFITVVLIECFTQEDLDWCEQYFINLYNSQTPNGYNLNTFVNSRPKLSEATKKKISEKQKASYASKIVHHFHKKHVKKTIIIVNGIQKTHCSVCKELKDLNLFTKWKKGYFGIHASCRACNRIRTQNYRQKLKAA